MVKSRFFRDLYRVIVSESCTLALTFYRSYSSYKGKLSHFEISVRFRIFLYQFEGNKF
jgi:hypothetical protein